MDTNKWTVENWVIGYQSPEMENLNNLLKNYRDFLKEYKDPNQDNE